MTPPESTDDDLQRLETVTEALHDFVQPVLDMLRVLEAKQRKAGNHAIADAAARELVRLEHPLTVEVEQMTVAELSVLLEGLLSDEG